MSCSLIVSAFSASGLCAGQHFSAEITGQVRRMLEARGLKVERMEPLDRGGCFALLMYARAVGCHSLDLLSLRRDLTQDAAGLDLQLRIQREDLFRAMHRL